MAPDEVGERVGVEDGDGLKPPPQQQQQQQRQQQRQWESDPEKQSPPSPDPLLLPPAEPTGTIITTTTITTTTITTTTSVPEPTTTTHYPELNPPLPSILVVLGSFSALLASLGTINSIGVFQAYLSTHQLSHYSPQAVGWIFGVYVFLAFGGGVLIGGIFDKVGPRWLVAGGTVGVLAALGGVGSCREYWHFMLVFGVLGGLGTSMIFTPAFAAIGHWFYVHRAAATGFAATGGSAGGIIFPLLLDSLIPRIGFTWSTRVMALLALFLLAFANLLIRSRLPPKPATSAMPTLRPFVNPTFAVTSVGVYMLEWGLFIPLTYLPSYAIAHGISSTVALRLLAIFNAASFFGRWGPGFVADRVGRFNVMVLMVALCLGSTMGIWYFAAGRTGEVVAYAVIFGFASGSNITLTPACVGQLCETEEYGRHYAATYTLVSFGTLTGIPIAGQILSTTRGDYRGLILFTAACYTAGLAAFLTARVMAVGWKLRTIF